MYESSLCGLNERMNGRAAKEDGVLYRQLLKLLSLLSLFHFSFYFIKMIEEKNDKEFHERNLNNDLFHGKAIKGQRHKITGPRQHIF